MKGRREYSGIPISGKLKPLLALRAKETARQQGQNKDRNKHVKGPYTED